MSLELVDPETNEPIANVDMGMAGTDYVREVVLWDLGVSPDLIQKVRADTMKLGYYYTETFDVEDACLGNFFHAEEETLYALRRKVIAVEPQERVVEMIREGWTAVQLIVVRGTAEEIVRGVVEGLNMAW